jgi:hypothetical protein
MAYRVHEHSATARCPTQAGFARWEFQHHNLSWASPASALCQGTTFSRADRPFIFLLEPALAGGTCRAGAKALNFCILFRHD